MNIKFPQVFSIVLLISVCLASCDSIKIERRRYNKGVFIDVNWKTQSGLYSREEIRKSKSKMEKRHFLSSDFQLSLELDVHSLKKSNVSFLIPSGIYIPLGSVRANALSKTETSHISVSTKSLKDRVQSQTKMVQKRVSHSKKQSYSDFWFALVSAITGLSGLVFFKKILGRLKPLASWASKNTKKTKAVILISRAVMGVGAWFLGRELADYGVANSYHTTNALFGLTSLGVLLYPFKSANNKWLKHSFQKQKLFSFTMGFLGFLMLMNMGIQSVTDKEMASRPGLLRYIEHKLEPGISHLPVIRKSQNDKPGKIDWDRVLFIIGKVLVSIIALAVVLLSMYLVAIISCALSCEGHDAAAVVVLVIGWAACIYALVVIMKSIWIKWKQKVHNPS